ncbi:MAG: hypothetical protein R2752_12975 [Vicinamibacterales bacterium]
MTRVAPVLTALAVAVSLAGVAQARQTPAQASPPQAQQQKMPDVTLTGCLVQGSAPTVFVFENAKKDPKSMTEPAMKYVVVAGTEDLMLRDHLNHEVRITGQAEQKMAQQTMEEKDLPKLTAKSLTLVSNTCADLGR